jgi:N-acetylmuramoyl-L-alanine amidase
MREDVTGATPGGLKLPMRGRAPQDQSKQPEALPEDAEKKPCPKGPVIVIDPGHGGKDPGAVSHDGLLKEKEVTLRIATTVRKLLEARIRNSTVALTRDSDIFLAVQERTAFANSLNADLFVSIHCNAAEDASSRGIETYYLSKASSSRAMASAARENGISPDRMSDIDATLLDLLVASKKVESVKLAESVHSSLIRAISGTAPSRRDRGVKRAPFYVLLGAKMPAILIECGFINGRETENLKKDSFLGTMAGGIAEGVVEYLQGLGSKF